MKIISDICNFIKITNSKQVKNSQVFALLPNQILFGHNKVLTTW
jgi:hypothetical protein